MGVAVGLPADGQEEAYEKKYAKMKVYAKWVNVVAAGLLTAVAAKALWNGDATENCNPMLVRVVMGWMVCCSQLGRPRPRDCDR